MSEITREKVEELIDILDQGLCTGVGSGQPGDFCVEHAIFHVFNPEGRDQKSDMPNCVHPLIRDLSIKLNDMSWPSTHDRGQGLKRLAIAQLGTRNLQFDWRKFAIEFTRRMFERHWKHLVHAALEIDKCNGDIRVQQMKTFKRIMDEGGESHDRSTIESARDSAKKLSELLLKSIETENGRANDEHYICGYDLRTSNLLDLIRDSLDDKDMFYLESPVVGYIGKQSLLYSDYLESILYRYMFDLLPSKLASIAADILIEMRTPGSEFTELL